MKISKLFHLLYAFVMFLPILAVGSTVLISTFNMSSKEESEIHYKYETNEVNSAQDLVIGNLYYMEIDNSFVYHFPRTNIAFVKLLSCENYWSYPDEVYYDDLTGVVEYREAYLVGSTLILPYILDNTGDAYSSFDVSDEQGFLIKGYGYIVSTNDVINQLGTSIFRISDYNEIESVETHNVESKDVFYNSLDELIESPYFSWAYNSFLSTPITYIVGLFSIPTNHVIVELLSYWLAISIIWLVFDLIMYVPLLVHRWLDKGVLE